MFRALFFAVTNYCPCVVTERVVTERVVTQPDRVLPLTGRPVRDKKVCERWLPGQGCQAQRRSWKQLSARARCGASIVRQVRLVRLSTNAGTVPNLAAATTVHTRPLSIYHVASSVTDLLAF